MISNVISTCIIVPAALQRAGLKALLQGNDFSVVGEAASLELGVETILAATPDLVLIEGPPYDSEEFERLLALKEQINTPRVVVLVDSLPSYAAQALCDAGVEGLLKTDIAPAALIGYINLVMLGEMVVHRSVGAGGNGLAGGRGLIGSPEFIDRISDRELTVIRHLASGMSNKEIARELGIMDGTIKIHVRNIQRKLQLKNRTQIAVWAVENGVMRVELGDAGVAA